MCVYGRFWWVWYGKVRYGVSTKTVHTSNGQVVFISCLVVLHASIWWAIPLVIFPAPSRANHRPTPSIATCCKLMCSRNRATFICILDLSFVRLSEYLHSHFVSDWYFRSFNV